MIAKSKEKESGTKPVVPSVGAGAALAAAMFGAAARSAESGTQSRRHEFQQLIFTLLNSCNSADEARSVMFDLQDAVSSTMGMIDGMVW